MEYQVSYSPELNVWKLKDCNTNKCRVIDEYTVQTLPDELWHIFNKAQVDHNIVQCITLAD